MRYIPWQQDVLPPLFWQHVGGFLLSNIIFVAVLATFGLVLWNHQLLKRILKLEQERTALMHDALTQATVVVNSRV